MSASRDSDVDEFVRTRGNGLLRVAYLLTGDRHAAEDLAAATEVEVRRQGWQPVIA